MARIRPSRRRDDRGFTLPELLVVILIIGVLAAIALPLFLHQSDEAMDADAKANARDLVTHMEACWHSGDGYTGCSAELDRSSTGLPIGTGPGEVHVASEELNTYVITAISKAQTSGVHHAFSIRHTIADLYIHECTPAGQGGCAADGSW
jgi:type IV pilus assembly protein PilA